MILGGFYPHTAYSFPLVFLIAVWQYVVMVCIYCAGELSVINSRPQKRRNQVWRRRRCDSCKALFTTIEIIDLSAALNIKRSTGDMQPLLRDKLFISIYDSCRHRPYALKDANELTATVLSKLLHKTTNGSITSRTIIETTLHTLQHFDQVAAIHYAAFHPER